MDHDQTLLDKINADLTQILVGADQQCHPYHNYPWSPDLHQAYLDDQFWVISLGKKCTK